MDIVTSGAVVAGIIAITEGIKRGIKAKSLPTWEKIKPLFFILPMILAGVAGIALNPESAIESALAYVGAAWAAYNAVSAATTPAAK